MNGRSVAAWSGACLFAVMLTTNPAYRLLGLAAAALAVAAGAGLQRSRKLATGLVLLTVLTALLNAAISHLGGDALFSLPAGWAVIGGRWTLEALVYGVLQGLTLAAAVLAVAPLSLLLEPHELVDALPSWLARSGAALSASLNLVPVVSRSFTAVVEAQRLRGWRPRGPRSWREVAVPVVLTAIEDSIQLAEAMEARGYGGGPRTAWSAPRWTARDLLVAVTALASAGLLVGARVSGSAVDWAPYPVLSPPIIEPLGAVACLLLLGAPLAWWRRPSAG
jgi:energy-coupling factor transport system permease protein